MNSPPVMNHHHQFGGSNSDTENAFYSSSSATYPHHLYPHHSHHPQPHPHHSHSPYFSFYPSSYYPQNQLDAISNVSPPGSVVNGTIPLDEYTETPHFGYNYNSQMPSSPQSPIPPPISTSTEAILTRVNSQTSASMPNNLTSPSPYPYRDRYDNSDITSNNKGSLRRTSLSSDKRFKGQGSNKKERRRTQSINNAFSNLRDCIPNVPIDTKLSKIKTLRLATSYIEYLMKLLDTENPEAFIDGFKAEIHKKWNEKSEEQKKRELAEELNNNRDSLNGTGMRGTRGSKGGARTGWPQHVWALELKQ